MITTDPAALLRDVGLRATGPRIAVVDALEHIPHASADAVFARVSEAGAEISLQTVYNVLHDLAQAGLARSIEPADHPARYELRVGDNHHHVVCTSCGTIADVDCAIGEAPCLTPSDDHGFAVTAAEVTYWGLCPACQAGATPATR